MALASVAIVYKVLHVAARIVDMDIDMQRDGNHAAWRRYFVQTVMATFRSADIKSLVRVFFGQIGKPSKTFGNIFALANSAQAASSTLEERKEVRAMGIEVA